MGKELLQECKETGKRALQCIWKDLSPIIVIAKGLAIIFAGTAIIGKIIEVLFMLAGKTSSSEEFLSYFLAFVITICLYMLGIHIYSAYKCAKEQCISYEEAWEKTRFSNDLYDDLY